MRDLCSSCGKTVIRTKGSRPEIVCHECRRKARPRPVVDPGKAAACETCGADFIARPRRSGRFCSVACANKWSGPRKPRAKTRPFLCVACGRRCMANNPHQRYCSDTCKKRGRANFRRRCRKFGVPYDGRIKAHEVYERDGWRCHICGRKVRRDWSDWAHPLNPTLDHLVPLSAGPGSPGHVRSNVATACFGCNTAKGNRGGGEQLALVG